jgi:hypothetical protein
MELALKFWYNKLINFKITRKLYANLKWISTINYKKLKLYVED